MSTKLIILSETKQAQMTFEEVYEKYKGLLNKKAYPWSQTYGMDEMYQVASISLWNAYEKYDHDTYPVPFMVVASKFIDYGLLAYHAKHKPKFDKKTSQIKSMTSLQSLVFNNNGDELELEDLIGEAETYSVEVVDRLVLDRLFKKFSKNQQQDILSYVNGYKIKELVEASTKASLTTAARMRGAFMRFRALYIKEMVM